MSYYAMTANIFADQTILNVFFKYNRSLDTSWSLSNSEKGLSWERHNLVFQQTTWVLRTEPLYASIRKNYNLILNDSSKLHIGRTAGSRNLLQAYFWLQPGIISYHTFFINIRGKKYLVASLLTHDSRFTKTLPVEVSCYTTHLLLQHLSCIQLIFNLSINTGTHSRYFIRCRTSHLLTNLSHFLWTGML